MVKSKVAFSWSGQHFDKDSRIRFKQNNGITSEADRHLQ